MGLQARASELCGGALQVGDVTLHKYGGLVDVVLNKTRQETLDPLARVAPRLPTPFKAHDPFLRPRELPEGVPRMAPHSP